MTVNLATAVYKSTGSTTGRSLGARAADIINVKDYGAKGDGSTDDTAAIQAAINAAFGPPASPHGQGSAFLNAPLYFPGGNYVVTSPLYIKNTLGGLIYGAGNGTSQLFYQGSGAEGNSVSVDFPNFSPIFMLDGVAYTMFSDLTLTCDHTHAPTEVTLTTSAGTSAGNATLHFTSVPSSIKANMLVFDATNPTAINAYVLSTTSTTVVLSANVAAPGVGNGDTLYFVTSVVGIYPYQTGANGTTSAIQFRNMNFNSFGTGIFSDGTVNCENCSLYDVNFDLCAYAGVRILGFNTLNWQVIGGSASQCGTVSTFISTVSQGNGSAAYSVTTGSITAMVNVAISGGAAGGGQAVAGVDIYHAGSQAMAIIGGRSESLTPLILNGSIMSIFGWNWGCTTSTGCTMADLTFSGIMLMEGCDLSPVVNSGTALLAALRNDGVLNINGTIFTSNGTSLSLTGTSGARFYLNGTTPGLVPSASTLFGSYTGSVIEYDPIENTVVGSLPVAAAKFAGLRGFVTDNTAAASGNFGAVAANAGSGSNGVPVYCDGTNWLVG